MAKILMFDEWCNQPTINECVIAKFEVGGSDILVKNRDRAYVAPIEVVHELIDGVEVAYLHDKITDWSEGINEFGIGVVNSALKVKEDEKQGSAPKKKKKEYTPQPAQDGIKIREALTKKTLEEARDSILNYVGKDPKDVGVTGETLISDGTNTYLIEMTSKTDPSVSKIPLDKFVVRTNHGIENPDLGYTKGKKRESSISRKEVASKEISKAKSVEDAMNRLAQHNTKDNFLNPYRDSPHAKMHTTAQLGYDLKNRILYVRYDEKFGKFEGIRTDLPMGHVPKIQLVISPVTEEIKDAKK
jgi:hypothetical protein